MKKLFANQTFAMFFVSVAALVVGTWLIKPDSGPIAWFSHGGSFLAVALKDSRRPRYSSPAARV